MQHQILINVIIFVAYVLNLPLNTQRSHSRSQRLVLAHDRRPIYRAPTYIAVPLLGPHQPRYIGLTLYKTHLCGQLNCWSLRCSWSIACRRCSNYIFILNWTHSFNRLGKDNCKTRRETFRFGDFVRLILEIWRYIKWGHFIPTKRHTLDVPFTLMV